MPVGNGCDFYTGAGDISALLEITAGSVVSVVGCGGKTSLIELISMHNSDKKVLISPTTKTFPMVSDRVMLNDTLENCIKHKPQIGVQCLGIYNSKNKKLEALPGDILADMVPDYDIVLIEADGSRWLPCKGWRDNEPVIPSYSTLTVGVVTMSALGKAATAETVHHLPEFLALTGLKEGEIITNQVLEDMVCLPGGMFKDSAGHQYLLVNRVEDESTIKETKLFLKRIKEKYPNRFKRLIYGSVHSNEWHEV